MKAFKTMCFVAAAAIFTLFTGCFNISGGNTGNMNETVEKNGIGKREITLTITNYDDLLEEASYTGSRAADVTAARTITAASFAPTALTYYITGNSSNGEDLIVSKVDPYSWEGNKGKVSLAVDAFTWDLQLYAVPTTDYETNLAKGKGHEIKSDVDNISEDIKNVKEYAVLAGKTSIDMYYTTDAYFALSPNGLDKEQQVNLTLTLGADWTANPKIPAGYTVKAGIYDMETGEVVSVGDDSDSEMTVTTTGDGSISETTGFAYTANTSSSKKIKTGTYNFVVTFRNEITNRTYVWSDVIIIIPGKPCVADVTIPNVIGKLPKAPENFVAGYVAGSEDGAVTDRYRVVFTWDDMSNNESYFEIQMVDVEALREDLTTIANPAAAADSQVTVWKQKYTDASDSTKNAFAAWTNTTSVSWTDIDAYFNAEHSSGDSTFQYVYPDFVQRWGADFYATEEHADSTRKNADDTSILSSLLANSESAEFYLPLGTSYIARIRAVNDAGYSDPLTVDLTDANKPVGTTAFTGGTNAYGKAEYGTLYTAPVSPATTPTWGITGAARTNAATTISRYRVRYNLQGGRYDPDGTGSTAVVTGDIVEYYCQDATTGNYILYPSAVTKESTDPYLQNGTSFFSYWAMGLETISNDTVYPYKKGESNEPELYKYSANLELYALYGAAKVDVLYADKYPIYPYWVKYGYTATADTAPSEYNKLASSITEPETCPDPSKIKKDASNQPELDAAGNYIYEEAPDLTPIQTTIEITKNGSESPTPSVHKYMWWKLTVPKDCKYNYEKITLRLYKGNVVYFEETLDAESLLSSGDNPSAKDGVNIFKDIPLKRLPNGTYQLLITATYGGGNQNGIIVTLPLSLSIVDEASS